MSLPRLPLRPLGSSSELLGHLPVEGPVLWLEGEEPAPDDVLPVVKQLRGALRERALTPALRAVPVTGPSPGRNPWAHRQDRQRPLRWGPGLGLEGEEQLSALGLPPLAGVVFVGRCAGLADQPLRALLRQLAPAVLPDAPLLALEPNGRALARVLGVFGRDPGGEGDGTMRTAEELRRLLETGGFGVEAATGLGRVGRRRRLLGQDLGAPWLALRARAIRGGEEVR